MRRLLLLTLLLSGFLLLEAQQTLREEILRDPNLSASNSVVYPKPQKALTPAPKGMKPFYLSHYGRHGSRYLTKPEDYSYVPNVLKAAEEKGKLTPLGKDVLARTERIARQAKNRYGELTIIGVQQHKDIARRMTEHFPQIFKGKTVVEAYSTLVPRCILSMAYATQQLVAINPHLQIKMDASSHELHYMNYQDSRLRSIAQSDSVAGIYKDFCKRHWDVDRLPASLFNDTAYVREHIDKEKLGFNLFRLAGSLQNTELRDSLTLYDIFTPEELYNNWLMGNVWWFLGYGFSPLNGSEQPFVQRHLLRQLIADADSCIQLSTPSVQLRYGHDTILLPLVCLMGINGYDVSVSNLESLADSGWIDIYAFPMSGNLQFVFYRKNAKDRDVLMKILLNEEEATLPIPTSQPPYYRWSDVRSYLLRILETYHDDN